MLSVATPGVASAKTTKFRSSAVIQKQIDRLMSRIDSLKEELKRSQSQRPEKPTVTKNTDDAVVAEPIPTIPTLGPLECVGTMIYNSDTGTRYCSNPLSSRILVTSPNGGETYYNGVKDIITKITWVTSHFDNSPLRIDLVNDRGLDVKNIARNLKDTGSYDWKADPSLSPGSYKIRVSNDSDNVPASDQSDGYFATVAQPVTCKNGILYDVLTGELCSKTSQLTLVWPNGGETLQEGKTYDIKWTGGSPEWRVRLNLVSSDLGHKPARMRSMPNDGEEKFTLPVNLVPEGEYYFQIERELIPYNYALNNPAFYGPHMVWDYSDKMIMIQE